MSGIAGLIRFDGGPADAGAVETMIASMAHRGPDGIETWSDGAAALACALFRTTPEALQESQPLRSDDGEIVLVMDGRVDNCEDLRSRLSDRGVVPRGRSDAELVLQAYRVWGSDCIDHIDGDFAFVIWDANRRVALCCRDRLGARPFYYHWDGTCLAFASELHAIVNLPRVPARLNETMIAETIICDEISWDQTFWTDIRRLPGAHRLVVRQGSLSRDIYWQPATAPEIRYRSRDDYAEHFRELLFDSVRRLSRSHLPIGCEVSGGLDSSGIFGAATRLQQGGTLPAPGLDAYSLDFADGSMADEITYSQAVGHHLGQTIRPVPPSLPPLDWYRDWAAQYRDFPPYPNSAMFESVHAACREAGSRVLLTGFGGDEWCFGSRHYYADLIARMRLLGLCDQLRRDAAANGLRTALRWAARYGGFALLPSPLQDTVKSVRDWVFRRQRPNWRPYLVGRLERLLEESRARNAWRARRHGPVDQTENFTTLHSARRANAREIMNHLASRGGIECRDPLTTTPMVEFCFRTRESIRCDAEGFRLVQRLALRDLVPESVRNRQDKAEFSTTLRRHFLEIDGFGDRLMRRQANRWLEPGQLETLIAVAAGQTNFGMEKWVVWGIFGSAVVAETQELHS